LFSVQRVGGGDEHRIQLGIGQQCRQIRGKAASCRRAKARRDPGRATTRWQRGSRWPQWLAPATDRMPDPSPATQISWVGSHNGSTTFLGWTRPGGLTVVINGASRSATAT
jgi:hypothetical protein